MPSKLNETELAINFSTSSIATRPTMDPYQNDQLEQGANQVKRRTSSLCSTPPPSSAVPASITENSGGQPLPTPPDTVLLGLWPFATDEQIDFYLDGYNLIYPSATVIAVKRGGRYRNAALDVLTYICEKPSTQHKPQILLHLFGNDGAADMVTMLRSFRTRTGGTLPIRAVIMDSTPAIPIPSLSDAIDSPQRLLLIACTLLWTLYTHLLAFLTLGHSDSASERVRSGLHDPTLVPSDARKVYIWAARDLMFSWRSSHSHNNKSRSTTQRDGASSGLPDASSDECDRYEYAVKRSTVDEKGRWSGNQERYWSGLEQAWEGEP